MRFPSLRHVSLVALTGAAVALSACSPGLNWREVHLAGLTTLLPCKPDSATRPIALGDKTVDMDMVGCQVAGALFAVSHIQAADAAQAPDLMARLRAASVATVQAGAVHPTPNSGDAQTSFDVRVDGRRPDGAAVQARFKWMAQGRDVYQVAVYAEHLTGEQTETPLGEVRFR